ncbi:MAG TPA: hypothetical protein VL361_01620 [Candidatus Limnocylindrales bacterium]|jgi:uncharacterized protein (TIGR03067 family)|nr:hypothetical protein [Candidatus Limnocylindrales bacterium]
MKQTARFFSFLSIILLLSAWGCSTLHKSDATALQGTWTGRETGVTPATPRLLIISGTQMEYRGAISNDWGKGTFTVREDTQPKQLVVGLTECGIPQYVGKTCYLIYKIESGTLTLSANEPGSPTPPLSFDAEHARHMEFKKE